MSSGPSSPADSRSVSVPELIAHFNSTMSSPSSQTSRSRSPKRSSRSKKSSPKRRPLHERSDSQGNKRHSPTIRIVDDDDAQMYSKTPFPSQPSQILRPSRTVPGYVFEDRGCRVSDSGPPDNANQSAPLSIPPIEALVPKPLQPRRNTRGSTISTGTSDADTTPNNGSPFSPASSRFSQQTTPPSSPVTGKDEKIGSLGILQEVRPSEKVKEQDQENGSPRHRNPRPTIRAVIPSNATVAHHIKSRPSETSIASSASSDTLTFRAHTDRNASRTSLASSKHKKSRSAGSSRSSKRASSAGTTRRRAVSKPLSKTSTESFNYSLYSAGSERPRSASAPATPSTHVARQISYERALQVQFPLVRPPSASRLYAESQPLPKHPSRMQDRTRASQWSSALSTIQSESERGSQTLTSTSGHSSELRRHHYTSFASSPPLEEEYPSGPSTSSVSVPAPLFSGNRTPVLGRESDEHDDTVGELHSPNPLRQQRSGYLHRNRSVESRPSSANSDRSFIEKAIPAWARVYYRRGERTSLGAPDSSTDASDSRLNTATSAPSNSPVEGNFPLSIFRPRNRPREGEMDVRDSMAISEAPPVEQDLYVVGPPRSGISEPFTPRLRPDRRSNARLSYFRAPSFDEALGSLLFSTGNRQILLFALGFILPFTWIIASFLPLPPKPGLGNLNEKATQSQLDIERQMALELGGIDERRYRKAQWWRTLNRIMSIVGIMLIGAIIALGIIASKM